MIEDTSRLEAIGRRSTVLAKDFDGAVYVAQVHPAEITNSVVIRWMLRVFGFLEEYWLAAGILVVTSVGWAIWAIASRIRRWVVHVRARGSTT